MATNPLPASFILSMKAQPESNVFLHDIAEFLWGIFQDEGENWYLYYTASDCGEEHKGSFFIFMKIILLQLVWL